MSNSDAVADGIHTDPNPVSTAGISPNGVFSGPNPVTLGGILTDVRNMDPTGHAVAIAIQPSLYDFITARATFANVAVTAESNAVWVSPEQAFGGTINFDSVHASTLALHSIALSH